MSLLFQLTSGNPDTSRENAKFELTKKRVVGVERSVNAENGTELMDTRSEFQLAPSGRNYQNGGAPSGVRTDSLDSEIGQKWRII